MPSLDEILNSLLGSYHLALRDTDGYRYFNNTAEGFWRSFAAILVIAPLILILSQIDIELQIQLAEERNEVVAPTIDYGRLIVVMILEWIAFPVAMVFVARALDLSHRYAGYIIVYNWSSILITAALSVPMLLFWIGIAGPSATIALSFVLFLPVFYYRWFIALTALDTTSTIAVSLVILEFLLSLVIASASAVVFG